MFCPDWLCSCLVLKVQTMRITGAERSEIIPVSPPHMLQPCERTQLDFMAEQCSQTNLQPLYLLPNTASFYTWIPAVGFTQGGTEGEVLFSVRKATKLTLLVIFRGRAVPIHVPVRWGRLHREPRLSVCGRNSLWVRPLASLWPHSCLSEREMSGRDD